LWSSRRFERLNATVRWTVARDGSTERNTYLRQRRRCKRILRRIPTIRANESQGRSPQSSAECGERLAGILPRAIRFTSYTDIAFAIEICYTTITIRFLRITRLPQGGCYENSSKGDIAL